MTLQVEFWELASLLLTMLVGAGGMLISLSKIMVANSQKHLDMRFDSLQNTTKASDDQIARRLDAIETAQRDESLHRQRTEDTLHRLQVELPQRYVNRDDYIRGQTVIEAKLDALASKLETAQLRAATTLHNIRDGL